MRDRPWLAAYPEGVPAEIDPEAYPSIPAVLEEAFSTYAQRPAFHCMGRTLSYAELESLSAAFAAWFQRHHRLQPGDRVALMMPNVLQYPIALCGALRAGLVVVNVNPLSTPRELRHQLADSGARAIVIVENFGHVLEAVIDDTDIEYVITTGLGDLHAAARRWLLNAGVRYVKRLVPAYRLPGAVPLRRVLAEGAGATFTPVRPAAGDMAFLQYTGGTTGPARGAILSHRNIIANLEQARAWLGGHLTPGGEVIITALPLYHIFSLLANALTFMRFGGENVLVTNPRDLKGFVRLLNAQPFTAFTGVNTLFNGLLNTPGFDRVDFSRLHITLGGGMAVQGPVAERWRAVTGNTLVEAYGLTETSPAVCINPLDRPHEPGCVGLPIPSTEVRIADADGQDVGVDEVGELCVRGPQVMSGYWNRPEETAAAFFPDGWFRTGDMARLDPAGFVHIVDRLKDMVIISGFNVYPNEVESVLAAHPGVREAAVIGVPGPRGERLRAFVVPTDDTVTHEQLIEHCERELTRYKVPRSIEFREELPKTNVGKVLRRALREEAAASSSTG